MFRVSKPRLGILSVIVDSQALKVLAKDCFQEVSTDLNELVLKNPMSFDHGVISDMPWQWFPPENLQQELHCFDLTEATASFR